MVNTEGWNHPTTTTKSLFADSCFPRCFQGRHCKAEIVFQFIIQQCSRDHKEKLTLQDLMIMPVQRIPRYELILKVSGTKQSFLQISQAKINNHNEDYQNK